MRHITTTGERPEPRADEIVIPAGGACGHTFWGMANDEDFCGGNRELKKIVRRTNRRKRQKDQWGVLT